MSRKAPAANAPMLETERLVLRPVSANDADSLHQVSNEPNVCLYLWDNQPVSEATIKGFIAQSDRMISNEKIGLFGIRTCAREDLLGFCGFVRLEDIEEPELWYELTQEVWGRGLATEAAWACVRYAFEEVGMERVIEKLGMRYLGNINSSAPEVPYLALYREDFLAGKATD